MLSSRNFRVLCFTFRTIIYFELMPVKGVRIGSLCIFFACGCSVVPAPFVEKTIFFYCIAFTSLSKISLAVFIWVYIWALYSVSLTIYSSPILCYFDSCSFVVSLEVEYTSPPTLFFSVLCWYPESLAPPYKL